MFLTSLLHTCIFQLISVSKAHLALFIWYALFSYKPVFKYDLTHPDQQITYKYTITNHSYS